MQRERGRRREGNASAERATRVLRRKEADQNGEKRNEERKRGGLPETRASLACTHSLQTPTGKLPDLQTHRRREDLERERQERERETREESSGWEARERRS